MNLSHGAVKDAVYAAVADLNESLSSEQRVPLNGTVPVFAFIDSLAALNLLLRVEQRLSDAVGRDVDLAEGDFYETTVFRSPTLDELIDAIHRTLATQGP